MIHAVKSTKEINKILEIKNSVIILNFHSENCGPCILQMPILQDLSNDLKLTLLTFDTDNDNDNTLNNFLVSSTPTTKIFKNKKLQFTYSGFMSYEKWEIELLKYF